MDPLDEKRNGYSLADVAEIMNQMSVLETEHGEPGYRAPFQQFLRSKGLTEETWAHVYNDWHQTWEADPALAAKFHTYMAQVRQRQMLSQQPNVSGESMGGVSLEAYAKISAQIQTGAVVEQLVAAEGLSMDQWQAGQAAWVERMGQCSPTDPIIVQFGQLYQKWSPNHQASMEAATERILADHADQEGRGGGMSKALDMDNAPEFFDHADVRVRARGVREMIRIWELNWDDRDARMQQLTQRACDEAVRILQHGAGEDRPGLVPLAEPPDGVDIHRWSAMVEQEQTQQDTSDLVYGSLKDLAGEKFMSPAQNDAAKAAVQQAIARLEPRARKVEELFGQVSDELKRTQVRQLIDDYRETLEGMREALGDWEHTGPEAAPPTATAPSAPAPASALATPEPENGLIALLKSLPIIGNLLRMLGL
ncbi:MAG: hypothetical protein VYE22_39275 [Myxococcota bacterium]|nr:hypothetical protein [Myxococcota bacterium]